MPPSYYLEGSCQLTTNYDQLIELLGMGRPGLGFRSKAQGSSQSNAMDHNYTSPGEENPWNALLGEETSLTVCFSAVNAKRLPPRQTLTRTRLSYRLQEGK
jgi:hypothetical protein